MTTPLVTSNWLNKHLNDDDLVILDASQQIAADNIVIAGARYIDIKTVFSDTTSQFPNTFPSVAQFVAACQQLGIDNDSKIVVYDNKGIFISPRVWWMFKTMGFHNIAVLDGGLPEWLANGYETETGFDAEFEQGDFKATFNPEKVKNYDFVKDNVSSQNCLVIDARSPARFNGEIPEARAGLKSGNIPNSINIHYGDVLDNGKLKPLCELTKVFDVLKAEKRPLVFTCGSGITACIILLASELVMERETGVYDGSWTEWTQLEN